MISWTEKPVMQAVPTSSRVIVARWDLALFEVVLEASSLSVMNAMDADQSLGLYEVEHKPAFHPKVG